MVRSKCKEVVKDDSFEMDKVDDLIEEEITQFTELPPIIKEEPDLLIKREPIRRGRPPLSSYEKKEPPAPVRVGGRMKVSEFYNFHSQRNFNERNSQ